MLFSSYFDRENMNYFHNDSREENVDPTESNKYNKKNVTGEKSCDMGIFETLICHSLASSERDMMVLRIRARSESKTFLASSRLSLDVALIPHCCRCHSFRWERSETKVAAAKPHPFLTTIRMCFYSLLATQYLYLNLFINIDY